MKHDEGKAFWLVKVMKIMKWNDGTDAPSGVGAFYRALVWKYSLF